jgi:hypothetical protein
MTVWHEAADCGSNALLVPSNDLCTWSSALQRASNASVREALEPQSLADLRSTGTWKLRAMPVIQAILKRAPAGNAAVIARIKKITCQWQFLHHRQIMPDSPKFLLRLTD